MAPPARAATSTGTKSLQEISAAKTLEVLQNDKNSVQTLSGLSHEEIQVLLPHIWQEHQQLLEIKRRYTVLHVYQERRDYFRARWRYRTVDDDESFHPHDLRETEWVQWSEPYLTATSDPQKPVKLCCCQDNPTPCEKAHAELGRLVPYEDALRPNQSDVWAATRNGIRLLRRVDYRRRALGNNIDLPQRSILFIQDG